ncbi:MAG: autotransporter outer membrane beta-barrel domain-containing protein, partial [Opitutales bacterium]|nr:autotransporter outer membrane beta-barrel domain-containing protein [Opitutales bacterium]
MKSTKKIPSLILIFFSLIFFNGILLAGRDGFEPYNAYHVTYDIENDPLFIEAEPIVDKAADDFFNSEQFRNSYDYQFMLRFSEQLADIDGPEPPLPTEDLTPDTGDISAGSPSTEPEILLTSETDGENIADYLPSHEVLAPSVSNFFNRIFHRDTANSGDNADNIPNQHDEQPPVNQPNAIPNNPVPNVAVPDAPQNGNIHQNNNQPLGVSPAVNNAPVAPNNQQQNNIPQGVPAANVPVQQNNQPVNNNAQNNASLQNNQQPNVAPNIAPQNAQVITPTQQNIAITNNSTLNVLQIGSKVLDTSHEQTFVARNVARMLQTSIESHSVLNHAKQETLGKNQSANNVLWFQVIHGHSHKRLSGLPNNCDTTGVLAGYSWAFNEQQKIGLFAGFTDTDINYKGSYRGTYGRQKSHHIGTYISAQTGKFLFRDIFCFSQNTYSDDIKSNSFLNVVDSNTKYHGTSCSNKFAIDIFYQNGDHIFCPEFAIHCDYVTQKGHSHFYRNQVLTSNRKTHDLFITCSSGIRYTQIFNKKIQPQIFLGYEFSIKNKIGTRADSKNATLWSSPINKGCVILDTGINFEISDQSDLFIGYSGNYNKHRTLH